MPVVADEGAGVPSGVPASRNPRGSEPNCARSGTSGWRRGEGASHSEPLIDGAGDAGTRAAPPPPWPPPWPPSGPPPWPLALLEVKTCALPLSRSLTRCWMSAERASLTPPACEGVSSRGRR